MDWQPIETAPMDATPILLKFRRKVGRGKIMPWSENGTGIFFDDHDRSVMATHWMPLPEPPK